MTIKAGVAKKPGKGKQATAETAAAEMLATIADDCDNVLVFLQAVAIKYPRVLLAPLSLLTDKNALVWFQRWIDVNLPKLLTPAPQDHLGLTGVLTDVTTQMHTAKALRTVVAAHREMDKETKGWYHLPPTAQYVILAASATAGTSILISPLPTIHRFVNARNMTALQADFLLTYSRNN